MLYIKHGQKAIEIAAQRALINTSNLIQQAEVAEINRAFDRPTRWTLGSIRVRPTNKFQIEIGTPDGTRASKYLTTQADGGQRTHKAFERALQLAGVLPSGWVAVPGIGATKDAYGNMPASEIRQILSWFNAAENSAGSMQNMTQATRDKRRKGTRKVRGFEYFAIIPGRGGNLRQPGIYKRTTFGFGKAIKPVLIFVRAAKYKSIFKFVEVAERVANDNLSQQFNSALEVGWR